MSSHLHRLGLSSGAHPWRVIGAWVLLLATAAALASSFGAPMRDDWDVPGARAQQVDALLGTGARHVPVVAHRCAERRGERRGGGHEQDPGADHAPRMGGGRAAEAVEVRRHGGLLRVRVGLTR